MKWTIRDPKRFLLEHDSVEQLAADVDWISGLHWRLDTASLLLAVDLNLLIHGRVYEVSLTYPDAFPDTPAYIRPRDPSQRWTIHQYGAGGSLCLEWQADNWISSITGADLIRSAYKLLYTETHPDNPQPVPSAHRLTPGQEVRASSYRLVATPALLAEVGKVPSDTAVAICTNTLVHRSSTVCVISGLADATGAMKKISDVPKGVSTYSPLFAWKGEGFIVRSAAMSAATVNSAAELSALIENAGLSDIVNLSREAQSTRYRDTLIVIAGTDDGSLRAFGTDADEIHEYMVVGTAGEDRRLPPSHTGLPSLCVAIVGLGSLGSKIAVSLARSGCRKFLLVDDDIFLHENVCRNELS